MRAGAILFKVDCDWECVCVCLSWMGGLGVGWLYLSSGLLLQAISGELVRRNPGLRALLIRLLRLLTQEYVFVHERFHEIRGELFLPCKAPKWSLELD